MKRSLSMPRPVISLLSGFALLTVPSAAAPESADFLPIGPSGYLAGPAALVGRAPAIDGFVGPWLNGGGSSPGVSADGLSYPGLASGGGAISLNGAGAARAGRLLDGIYDDFTEGSVYFSVLVRLDRVGAGYRAFELHSGGFDDVLHRRLQIATGEPGTGPFDPSHFVVRVGGNAIASADLGPGDTGVNLFVGRVDLVGAAFADQVTIWRNPDPAAEPAVGDAVLTGLSITFDRVSVARFGDDGLDVDEIRIGSSYADVTSFDHVAAADSDLDGMRDAWERENLLLVPGDDAAGDPDADGLANLGEFENGANPRDEDTDGDGLGDLVEVTGGTNPADPDSDGDGLEDPEELVPGNDGFVTDPLDPDSDDDAENDGFEVVNGTDPTDPESNTAALGVVVVDGTRDVLYGPARAVQTIQTGYGDNKSEWNAAYATVRDGRLHLLFTGNLENNFNKLEIFLDTGDDGFTTFPSEPGNDGAWVMTNMVFDAGFTPEFHLIARRGGGKFDLDISQLGTTRFTFYEALLDGGESGRGSTGTGAINREAIEVAYDDRNRAGIGGAAGVAADQEAARAVTTGLELSIALSDIRATNAEEIRVMLVQANSSHGDFSNQSLGGLPIGTGNLGGSSAISFDAFDGEQFFRVATRAAPGLELVVTGYEDGVLLATVEGLPVGEIFHLRSSGDGRSFRPLIPALDITAATPQPLRIPVGGTLGLIQLYEGPSP